MTCILKVIYYFWLMFSKTSERMYLKIYHLDPEKLLSAPGITGQASLKKTEVKLELFTDTDIPLMVEKGIRDGIYQVIFDMQKLITNI